jgi:hypothetical protein
MMAQNRPQRMHSQSLSSNSVLRVRFETANVFQRPLRIGWFGALLFLIIALDCAAATNEAVTVQLVIWKGAFPPYLRDVRQQKERVAFSKEVVLTPEDVARGGRALLEKHIPNEQRSLLEFRIDSAILRSQEDGVSDTIICGGNPKTLCLEKVKRGDVIVYHRHSF